MDNIKIIFFDIDGTLIDVDTKKVTPKMLETLRRLKEKGIIICIATGRAPMAVPTFEGVELMRSLHTMDPTASTRRRLFTAIRWSRQMCRK